MKILTDDMCELYKRGDFYIDATPKSDRVIFYVREYNQQYNNKIYDRIKEVYVGYVNPRWYMSEVSIEKALNKALNKLDNLYYEDMAEKHNLEYVTTLVSEIRNGMKLKQEAYDILEKELTS